jgi:hypothetical protein
MIQTIEELRNAIKNAKDEDLLELCVEISGGRVSDIQVTKIEISETKDYRNPDTFTMMASTE